MRLIIDIDGVLCHFVKGLLDYCHKNSCTYEGMIKTAEECVSWDFFPADVWNRVKDDGEFWAALEPFPEVANDMKRLSIHPDFYLTARPAPTYVTRGWLGRHGFPGAQVFTVPSPLDKLNHLEAGDVLVDDNIETIRAARGIGVLAVLYSAPYHRSHDVSDLIVVKNMDELKELLDRSDRRVGNLLTT
jgi:uncharacterized HAD superfamily protein